MTARTRSSCLLAVLVAVAAVLFGCPAPNASTGVDQSRLEVLQAEARAVNAAETTAVAGWQNSTRQPPVRGHVHANIADIDTADAVTVARQETAKAIDALRANSWTIYFVVCVPRRTDDDVIDADSVLPPPTFDAWTFVAYGYKIVDGVSYFVQVNGWGQPPSGKATVYLWLRAPYSKEADPDLFPDRPPATELGASCVEQAAPPDGLTELGTRTIMDEKGPDAGGTKANGHR
jgi:hypothetical protein